MGDADSPADSPTRNTGDGAGAGRAAGLGGNGAGAGRDAAEGARVHAVAAYGLPGTLTELPGSPLEDAAWRSLLAAVRWQRLTGHLALAVRDGAFPVTGFQASELAEAHGAAMAGVLTLERTLLATVEALSGDGIETRVLKGAAAAHLDYPDSALRSFGDVDLLVRSADFRRATELLVSLGLRRRFAEPRRGFDEHFGKGASFWAPDGNEVDLHRTLALGPAGLRVRLDELWGSGTPFTVGGRTLAALGAGERLLHACYHAALGDHPPRLVPLRDVVQLVLSGAVDAERTIATAAAWRGRAVVAFAVSRAWAAFRLTDVVVLSAWAEQYHPTPEEERELAVYTSDSSTYAEKAVASLRAIPRLRDRLTYAAALAFPRRNYLSERQLRLVPRLRRGIGMVLPMRNQHR
jgi:hypothetical protein